MWVAALAVAAQGLVGVTPTLAQTPSEACADFSRTEREGRAQVTRRLAEVDAAANAGDTARFCQVSGDLVFLYRSLRTAAGACAPERVAAWSEAEAQTTAALSAVCP